VTIALGFVTSAQALCFVPSLPTMMESIEHLDDFRAVGLVSGLFYATYSFSCALGPILGQLIMTFISFQWMTTLFGLILMIYVIPFGLLTCSSKPRSFPYQTIPEPKKQTPQRYFTNYRTADEIPIPQEPQEPLSATLAFSHPRRGFSQRPRSSSHHQFSYSFHYTGATAAAGGRRGAPGSPTGQTDQIPPVFV